MTTSVSDRGDPYTPVLPCGAPLLGGESAAPATVLTAE